MQNKGILLTLKCTYIYTFMGYKLSKRLVQDIRDAKSEVAFGKQIFFVI